ncbi:sensor histidine kinase [Phenylobacterium aquaticum]|uniref:sensor histidine kinase n=1 Tax=Phenylobacterium aquaticum TaxID=1763816 RepID=UPI0026F22BFC|nr:histidine kinase dimerization/phosphoacceptor domain -containing protein [Phenylobacterium aquaticum]
MDAIADHPDAALSLARALIDTALLPLLLFDGDLKVVRASPAFCQTFDLASTAVVGRDLAGLGAGEWNLPAVRQLLVDASVSGVEIAGCETDLVRMGRPPRRLVLNACNVIPAAGSLGRILLTVHDVTEARRIESLNIALLLEKDELLRERDILLLEMQHRIANSLQIIASVLMLKARAVSSEESRQHLRDAHDRVLSVAAVQQHLQSRLGVVEVGAYLVKLCESLGASMITQGRDLALVVEADPATVSSHEAVSLGLIVTELVINALKHAFPEGGAGRIVVGYALGADGVPDQGWTLSVTDDGVGRPPAGAPTRIGLGTSVIEALAQQLDAVVIHTDAGPGARVAVTCAGTPAV